MVDGDDVMVTEVVVMKEDKPGGKDLQGPILFGGGFGSMLVGVRGKSKDIAAIFLWSRKALISISLHRSFQLYSKLTNSNTAAMRGAAVCSKGNFAEIPIKRLVDLVGRVEILSRQKGWGWIW